MVGASLIRVLGLTARFEIKGFEQMKGIMDEGKGLILAVWHGRTLLPVYYCRGLGMWAITSLSRDGEIQTRTISKLGYKIIRGSTRRGGVKAALIAAKRLKEGGTLCITPDGPLGPAHEVQEGIVFLATRANCPIIPVGVGLTGRKLLSAWDSYAVPYLFTKCAIVFGDPISPSEATTDDNGLAETIKNRLNEVQIQAQDIVGERHQG